MEKLTRSMRSVLLTLAQFKTASAYSMGVSLTTVEALSNRGLIEPVGNGHYAFPRSGAWQITDAGRAIVATFETQE